jgi:enhancer of polycomb-like protein
MTLHTESDHIHLVTDPTLVVYNSEGRPQGIIPYRLGGPSIVMRRDAQGVIRPFPGMLPAQVQHMMALQNGAISQHLKKMQPSAPGPQMRISSGGGMRPPTVSATNSQHQSSPPQPTQPQSTASPIVNQGSPAPSPVPVLQPPPNGVGRPAISMPHVEVPKADAALPNGIANGVTTSPQPEANGDTATSGTPQPKSRNLNTQAHIGIPSNGYH